MKEQILLLELHIIQIKKDWKEIYPYNLNAEPGDKIIINCYNIDGPTFGGGCFSINDKYCKCYNFRIYGKKILIKREHHILFLYLFIIINSKANMRLFGSNKKI